MSQTTRNASNHAPATRVPEQPPKVSATWTSREAYLLAAVCLLTGLVGYLFRGSGGLTATSAPASTAAPATQASVPSPSAIPPAAPSAEVLQPMAAPLLAALKQEPKNVEILVQLGNLYFDHSVYPEAIQYYSQALELKPNDVNVRTDLGTAYWYAKDAKKAIAEYEKSLKVDPTHGPTLMNMGIVKLNGLQDKKGAIEAWERLLKVSPNFQEKQRVVNLLAQAKAQP
jgi:tetratricopeptide (TPR) repeat protein